METTGQIHSQNFLAVLIADQPADIERLERELGRSRQDCADEAYRSMANGEFPSMASPGDTPEQRLAAARWLAGNCFWRMATAQAGRTTA